MFKDFRSLYDVSRDEYKDFVSGIKPEVRDIQIVELNEYTTATKIFSKKTGKCLCSRVSYKEYVAGQEPREEKYYIFEIPDKEESQPIKGRAKLVLETREQVQAFFDIISKLSKEKKDD